MKGLMKSIGMMVVLCIATGCQPPAAKSGPSSDNRLLSFDVRVSYVTDTGSGAMTVPGEIDQSNHTVTVNAPGGSDVTTGRAKFRTYGKAVLVNGAAQESEVTVNDFTAPVMYTVVAADDSTQDYTVTVDIAPANWKTITAFGFAGVDAIVDISTSINKTINVRVPWETTVTALVAEFTSTGQSVTVDGAVQSSGVTANDFTGPVVYRVTAADGTYRDYTVTVKMDAPRALWARSTTAGDRSMNVHGTAADASGNIFIAGRIEDAQYTFGPGVSVQGLFTESCALVKYDAAGNALWAQTESGGYASFRNVANDPTGNAYAAGNMGTTATFGTVTVTGVGGPLLVKYDAAGTAQWAKTSTAGDASAARFRGVAVDTGNNVYAVGAIWGNYQCTFGTGVTAQGALLAGGRNSLIVKYDAAGTALWARSVSGGGAQSEFVGVTVDPSGNVCAVGYIERTGALDFGNGVSVTNVSDVKNILVIKYDGVSGNALWARTLVAPVPNSWTEYFSVAADATGNFYAAGRIRDEDGNHLGGGVPFTFGPGVTATSFYADCPILVKYDQNGNAVWARTSLTRSYSIFNGVTVTGSGNIYAAGTAGSTMVAHPDFGGYVIDLGSNTYQTIIVAFDQDGTARWGRALRVGPAWSEFTGVTSGGSGHVYAAGFITGTGQYEFSPGITASGSSAFTNMVLVKYPEE